MLMPYAVLNFPSTMRFTLHQQLRLPGVYILRTQDPEHVYVGQSEDVRTRFQHHRSLAARGAHPWPAANGAELTCEIVAVEPDEDRRLELEREWAFRLKGPTPDPFPGRRLPRLTDAQVRMIRALQPIHGDGLIRRVAAELGVTPGLLYAIRKGRVYKATS